MYPHLDVVVGLAWSKDLESYVGGSVATGKVPGAGKIKGYDPDKEGCCGPPGWRLVVKQITSPRKKYMPRKPRKGLIKKKMWL